MYYLQFCLSYYAVVSSKYVIVILKFIIMIYDINYNIAQDTGKPNDSLHFVHNYTYNSVFVVRIICNYIFRIFRNKLQQ